jgi:hypothetical protein
MGKVATGYIIEQIVISCFLGGATLAFAAWRVYDQTREENKTLARPLHKRINGGLLVISIMELIWGIDPRGVWDIYPPEVIAACKDVILSGFISLGLVWMDAHLRILAESLGKVRVQAISEKISIGVPIVLTYLVALILLILSALTQANAYRAYFVYFLTGVICSECLAVTICLIHIIRIRTLSATHLGSGSEQLRKMKRLVIICVVIWFASIGSILVSFSSAALVGNTLRSSQIVEDKSHYIFYYLIVFQIAGVFLYFEAGRFHGANQENHQVMAHSRQPSRISMDLKQDRKNRTSSV